MFNFSPALSRQFCRVRCADTINLNTPFLHHQNVGDINNEKSSAVAHQ